MINLSKEQVTELHNKIIASTGGVGGLASEALLDSALSSALQTFDSKELYSTTITKIARITYNIIKNHPFVDGNKRTGIYVMLVLLNLNRIEVTLDNKEIVHIGESIADGTMNYTELVAYILEHC